MALATNHIIANANGSDASSYNTSSVTPTGDALILMWITSRDSGSSPEVPSSLGGTGWASGLSWTQQESQVDPNGTRRLTLYSATAPGSPSAGYVTINFTSAHDGVQVWIEEFTDTVTPEVLQTNYGSGSAFKTSTPAQVSLSSPTKATCGSISVANNIAVVPGSGFTQYAGTVEVESVVSIAIYDTSLGSTNPVEFTHGAETDKVWVAIVAEVGAAAAGSTSITSKVHFYRQQQGVA